MRKTPATESRLASFGNTSGMVEVRFRTRNLDESYLGMPWPCYAPSLTGLLSIVHSLAPGGLAEPRSVNHPYMNHRALSGKSEKPKGWLREPACSSSSRT